MSTSEPMMMGSPLGSPSSPMAPGGHNQSAFLPAYLMGEPSPMASPVSGPRLWSGPSSSPPRSVQRSTSFTASPGPNQSQLQTLGHTPKSTQMMRGKDKSGAPPVSGLLEHITSPTKSLPETLGDLSFSRGGPAAYTSFTGTPTQHDVSSVMSPTRPMSHAYTPSKKTPPSPAQRDPFYTQGESLQADDELDETWITVYGFPAAATSFILQQFSQYGNILHHVVATDGNWLHIHFQSKLQAKKALSKNGKVFGNSIMVGVSPCIDKSVMNGYKENQQLGLIGTPTSPVHDLNSSTMSNKNIRPLTAAYRAASSDHEVKSQSNTPQKSSNVISKALEYVFGW